MTTIILSLPYVQETSLKLINMFKLEFCPYHFVLVELNTVISLTKHVLYIY